MALNKTTLQSNLEAWMKNHSRLTSLIAMSDLATIYNGYAMGAEDPTGDPPLVVFITPLQTLVLSLRETHMTAATKIGTAIIAYWAGASFVLGTPPPTCNAKTIAIATPPPPTTLISGIHSVFVDIKSTTTYADKAKDLADIIDSQTKLVSVSVTGTIPPPTGGTLVVVGTIK